MFIKIIWSYNASVSFGNEVDFILMKWNIKEAEKFVDLVDSILLKLKETSFIGIKYNENTYSYTISKQTTLYYRILQNDIIELLLFWNNQRNPKELLKYL